MATTTETTTATTTLPEDQYKIADLQLAEFGRKELDLAEVCFLHSSILYSRWMASDVLDLNWIPLVG